MKYLVDVNGERIAVELDGAHATVDGIRHEVALLQVPGTPVRLVRIGEQVHRVVARRGGSRGVWHLDVDGARVETEALDERMRAIKDLTAASATASGPAPLVAPMPGLVVRVAVAVGDQVSAGQGLVVIEAMKMENELRSASAGVVTAVRAVTGQAVDKGAVLVEIGLTGRSACCGLGAAHTVDHFDYHEDGDGHDEEGQHLIQEEAIGDGGRPGGLGLGEGGEGAVPHGHEAIGEIDATGEQPHGRHDDVGHQAVHDLLERAADHHADGEIEHAAFDGKFAELRDH